MSTRFPIIGALIFMLLGLAFNTSAQTLAPQSFSFANPICKVPGAPNQSPVLFPNHVAGGQYSSTPAGLFMPGSQILVGPSAPGVYTITYYGAPCNCYTRFTVTISAPPTIAITNLTLCSNNNGPLIMTASPSTGLNYTWMPGSVIGPTQALTPINVPKTYTLYVTNSGGCSNSVSATGSIVTGTPVQINGNANICMGNIAVLSASGANNFTWSTGSNAGNITVTPTVTTVYSVTAIDNSGCISTGSKTVTVNDYPDLFIDTATVCSGLPYVLRAQGSNTSGLSYFWIPGGGNQSSITIVPQVTKEYTLIATRSGCNATFVATIPVETSYTAVTKFNYNYGNPLCTNSSDAAPILNPGFSNGGTFSSLGLKVDSLTGKLTMADVKLGVYQVTYMLAAKGCTTGGNNSVFVIVNSPVPLTITPPISITRGTSVKLSVTGGASYDWSPTFGLSCSDCPSPLATPMETTNYCVSSIVNSCYTYACVNIEVMCLNEGDLSVPNAFTPNGDSHNQKFCLRGWDKCNTEFSIQVFDRWGVKVFESNDPLFCWDGVFNGVELGSGVFVYVIKAVFNNDPEVIKKGQITILR